MFRKLYWVTEAVDSRGSCRLIGVYTSIPNLIKHGLGAGVDLRSLRLSLTKLDCSDGPLSSWAGPSFSRLAQDVDQFVASGEFSAEQCQALAAVIEAMKEAAA